MPVPDCILCGKHGRHGSDDHKPQPYMAPREFKRIRFLLGEDGKPLPQIDVAYRLGVTERAIRYYESGGREIPKLVADEMHRWTAEAAEVEAARESTHG